MVSGTDRGENSIGKGEKKYNEMQNFSFLFIFLYVILLRCEKRHNSACSQDKLSFNLYKWRA